MSTKLTLSLSNEIIGMAKSYAKENKTSLSLLVENYFRFLVEKKPQDTKTISPLVNELSGIVELPAGFDSKKEYVNYIAEKYS